MVSLPATPKKVEVTDLRLSYGPKEVLHGISFHIEPNEILGIIGPAQSGKTTLLRCINRTVEFAAHAKMSGTIKVDGEDVQKVASVYELRRKIGMVAPLPVGLPLSIYDNVAFAPRAAGLRSKGDLDELIEKCLRQAALWDEVKDRLDSLGTKLSGGHVQEPCCQRRGGGVEQSHRRFRGGRQIRRRSRAGGSLHVHDVERYGIAERRSGSQSVSARHDAVEIHPAHRRAENVHARYERRLRWGSIDIVTKTFPDAFTFEFRASTAYNPQSSLRDDFPMSNQGGTDWLGFDDGTREMPQEVADTSPTGSRNFPDEVERSFASSQFAPVPGETFLDRGGELLFGDTETIFGKRLGYLAGLNYKTEHKFYENALVRSYDAGGAVVFGDKTVNEGIIEHQWGSLVNLGLELSENHNLKFNFLRVQAAEDYAGRARGLHGDLTSPEDGTYMDLSVLNWTERSLTYFQLAGEHELPELKDVKFEWGAVTSTTTQEDPDFRAFQFRADPLNGSY